ncbi:hypothetical protein [Caballeronia sp. Lep1P3]|uniref:hypothetical protein n=1 Tax=Caballeronia sp. Lep1P3 TaxID=2878150 RepID=UPI001FD1B27D|nr:hypothetical protein [Caballeronia sp. Lep1P3]
MEEPHSDIEQTVGAIDARCHLHAINRRLRLADQFDRTPRTDWLNRRAPAWHVAEQRRANVAQGRGLRELGPPARAAALSRKRCCNRSKADKERRVTSEFDIEFVLDKHRIGFEQLALVHPDFGDRRESVEAQAPLAVRV